MGKTPQTQASDALKEFTVDAAQPPESVGIPREHPHPRGRRVLLVSVAIVALAVLIAGGVLVANRDRGQEVALQPSGTGEEGRSACDYDPLTQWVTGHEEWNRVAECVPEFAGYYFDGGTLAVRVTDGLLETAERARAAIVDVTRDPTLADPPVKAVWAEHSWQQLFDWYMAMFDQFGAIEGCCTMTYIDESAGRIIFAVEDPERSGPSARAAAERAGVPDDVFLLLPGAPMEPLILEDEG